MDARARVTEYYHRVYVGNLRHNAVRNNLGVLAIEEGRWTAAEKFLSESLVIDPDDAKAHYLLAKVKVQLGDKIGARVHITEALRLHPEQPEFKALSQEISSNP
jgi:Flp pilus assembly protein TadD